ncbi:MAG: hypothetical protein LLF76_10985 [Planctomycetaceae bacterium]|nr:hypothetical protein [Planctomycetaceae bacterium]
MKIRTMITVGMMLFVAGLAQAAEEQTQPATPRTPQERRQVGRRSLADREAMLKEMQASRAQVHQKAIDELVQIKKLAEEENAPKTAAAIQAMIDKRNEEYKKSMEQMERQRREREQQLQQKTNEQPSKRQRPQPTPSDAP